MSDTGDAVEVRALLEQAGHAPTHEQVADILAIAHTFRRHPGAITREIITATNVFNT